ncbi:energy-coupling factor ABC transporter ATP-binding protein [Sansalvadorimonas verongulae]|uniref:energy-coupling factor ABC transporter ATP-binding protein n=1 Tax=Sansalvadorimonas verongulae TaxID=2172824 RepID=UPI0012BBC775|nr:ABC transporter ATP-binding protein [Sansalvadorimonas verongulae]MTI12603.1 ABC transporter ATP-binding protein [Sansalvadorimonas verongulae]
MSAPLIQVEDLHFSYGEQAPVFQGASFNLYSGERIALLGPNGSGKTSLLRLVMGLLKPDSGTIKLFGQSMSNEKDFRKYRGRAGLLFQDSDDQLFCPTVLEEVCFGPLNQGMKPEEAKAQARTVLKQLGIEALEERITWQLSGGQKRLVALASVLAMEPEVLLLDEPTNALDNPTRERLIQILLELPQAMICIAHDDEFHGQLATRSLRVEGGCLVDA